MSDALYSTRLRWQSHPGGRGQGAAKLHGQSITLSAAPIIGGEPAWHVDYVPEVAVCELQPRSVDPIRSMTQAEVEEVDALLRNLFTSPR